MSSLSTIGWNIQDFLFRGTIGPFLRSKTIEKEILQEATETSNDPSPPVQQQEEDYKLPSVVVVGIQTAGKSTLLENITKVPIFPRKSSGVCTKFPIKVVLRGKLSV